MAVDTVEDRMIRIERGCERLHERLGLIEHRLGSIEPRLTSGITALGYELRSALETLRADGRAGNTRLRTQELVHFYWLLLGVISGIGLQLLLDFVP